MRSSASSYVGRSGAGLPVALAILAFAVLAAGCQRFPTVRGVPQPTLSPTVEYRVKRGDTPERIAAWHGADAQEVRRLNGIGPDDTLEPGRVLRVPERTLPTYSVRSGDTLGRIGQWYGVEVDALIRLNDVADVRKLQVGQMLQIPATAARDGRRAALASRRAPRAPAAQEPAPPPVASGPPATPSPPPEPEPTAPAGAEVDRTLAQASEAYDAADFEGSLAAAQDAERQLSAEPRDAADRQRLARAHLLAGMSHVALGRDEDARCSFQAAVALDRSIRLDPARTSPKVLSVFDDAQASR